MEDGERWPVGGFLNYNTVLQLDQFCGKQGKWIAAAYVLLFFSLQGMPDLRPKGIDLGVQPLAPFCLPTLPPYLGSKLSKLKVREPSPGRVALVSVKTQTESQTAQVEVQTTPVSVRP